MITRKGKPYRELRCSNCRTLLALEYVFSGRLSIKCHVCNTYNDIDVKSAKKILLGEGGLKTTQFISNNEMQKGGEN